MNRFRFFLNQAENIYELKGFDPAKRILPMEGVRGLAVILVFFVHYHALFGLRLGADSLTFKASDFLWSIGHTGVDLFFVLSGYLIYGAVINKQLNYLKFMKRRVARIYPTFLAVLAVYLILSFLLPSESKLPGDPLDAAIYILQNILLLPGIFSIEPIITVAWSLSYEFFFYLFLPLLVLVFNLRNWSPRARISFFTGLTILHTIFYLAGFNARYQLVMFISGVILYELTNNLLKDKLLNSKYEAAAVILLILSAATVYLLHFSPQGLPLLPDRTEPHQVVRQLLLFTSFLLFILVCIKSNSVSSRIFSWTPLRYLGNMSYSYYLIHALTLKGIAFVLTLTAPQIMSFEFFFWLALPVSFALTIVSSTALFTIIEKPFSLAAPKKTIENQNFLVKPVAVQD